jgi:Ca-activated chloride channel family protein
MGLVIFSGFAELSIPPTTDRKALVAAIDQLSTGRGTAIGSAMKDSTRSQR